MLLRHIVDIVWQAHPFVKMDIQIYTVVRPAKLVLIAYTFVLQLSPLLHYRLPIELSFTASLPQEFNFNLECRVKQKPTPLHLNVKASGYAIQMSLLYTGPSGRETVLPVQPQASKEISFGQVRKEASSSTCISS